ncbi:MAG: hypothetical protein ISS33_01900 [Candidatus Omnitrophica bacterium]|nr:hypothetical protein [Candidatus Omnitrophota bacterium]
MRKRQGVSMKVVSVLFGVVFLFNTVSCVADSFTDNLAAPKFTGDKNFSTEPFQDDIQDVENEAKRLNLFFSIGEYFLKGGSSDKFCETLSKKIKDLPQELLDGDITDINGDSSKDGEIGIVFHGKKFLQRIRIRKIKEGRTESGWQQVEKYEFLIEKIEDKMMENKKSSEPGKVREFIKLWDPKVFSAYTISRLVLEEKVPEAIKQFFTTEVFQAKKENLDVPAGILNKLLDALEKDEKKKETVRDFTSELIKGIVEFSGDSDEDIEVAEAVQKMAGQIWIIPKGVRFTADKDNMVWNKKRGESFIDVRTLPDGIKEVKEETDAGLYGRGIEGVSKIRPENIMEFAIWNMRRFLKLEKKLVQYVMLHGGRKVSHDARKHITEDGLSNPHKTLFVNAMLPSSFQPASTGPGHLQVKKMNGKLVGLADAKKINHGVYIQVNAKYDTKGQIVKVVCHLVREGERCFSAPGWRDYMIDIGGYGLEGFDDFSFPVTAKQAKLFDSEYDETELVAIEKALAEKGKEQDYAPYGALIFNGVPVVVKMNESFPEALWVNIPKNYFSGSSFDAQYEKIFGPNSNTNFVSKLGALCRSAKKDAPMEVLSLSKAKARVAKEIDSAEDNAASLGMTEGIRSFIDSSAACLGGIKKKQKTSKLVRVPVEILERIGKKDAGVLLRALKKENSSLGKVYVEFLSTETYMEVDAEEYEKFGIKKESLPKDFVMSRANTVTIFFVHKGEEFSANLNNSKWDKLRYFGDEGFVNPLLDTIISPVGHNYDQTGLARSIFFGMILTEIAANKKYTRNSPFVSDLLMELKKLYISGGYDADSFDLTESDLISIARGPINTLVSALNKLIKLLPIMPVNVNEQTKIYEHAKEAWIRA